MYKKWDIVLITFPFSDNTSTKIRPCVVRDVAYQWVTVLLISSRVPEDCTNMLPIYPDAENNLKADSVIKYRHVFTIHRDDIFKLIGRLSDIDRKKMIQKICYLHCQENT